MEDKEAEPPRGEIAWGEELYTVRTGNDSIPMALASPFQMTKHRVYVTLDSPNAPWNQSSIPDTSNGIPVTLPVWAYALETACRWAQGAQTVDDAARLIAQKLFDSGRFIYHPSPNYGSIGATGKKRYVAGGLEDDEGKYVAYFPLHKVLERLQGGHGMGEKFNCLDCALTVASLANILGARLRVGKLQNMPDIDPSDPNHYMDNRFEIKPIRAIGQECHGDKIPGVHEKGGSFFTYHAVAWAAPSGEFGTQEDFTDPNCVVYDACTEFLIDGQEVMAAGFALGDGERPHTYTSHLAADTPDGRPRCHPQPVTVMDIQLSQ